MFFLLEALGTADHNVLHNLIVTADTLDAAARGQLQQSAAEAGVQNVVICSTESFQ